MYCSSCGSPVTPGLSYCNRCGVGLSTNPGANKADPLVGSTQTESLVWAIVAVTLGGLGILIGLMAFLKNQLHLDNQLILLVSLLAFVPLLLADLVFIWLLIRSKASPAREAADSTQLKGAATKDLGEAKERLLSEPASVTDQTTRSLQPISRERIE